MTYSMSAIRDVLLWYLAYLTENGACTCKLAPRMSACADLELTDEQSIGNACGYIAHVVGGIELLEHDLALKSVYGIPVHFKEPHV